MAESGNKRPDHRGVRTPDGRAFQSPQPASRLAAGGFRAAGAAVGVVLRGVGKTIVTIWRLADALDSALWRGLKLGVFAVAGFLAATARTTLAAFADLFRWLPSRSGRAYTASSAVILIICGLWIVDEIRSAEIDSSSFDRLFRPPVDVEDPIVARIDARYVHLSEIEAAARAAGQLRENESLTAQAAFSRKLVESYVEQRLLARAAVEKGLQRDPVISRRINAARDRILGAAFMESRIEGAVTPDRVKRLYESQSDIIRLGDEVRARHIVVGNEEEARAIVAELAAGADFASIARARSLDRATAPLGGELGWFTKDMMTPLLAQAAFSTAKGELADLFYTEFGWHVLEVIDRRASNGVGFDVVEDKIRRFLTLREISETLAALKADEEVVYYRPESNVPTE